MGILYSFTLCLVTLLYLLGPIAHAWFAPIALLMVFINQIFLFVFRYILHWFDRKGLNQLDKINSFFLKLTTSDLSLSFSELVLCLHEYKICLQKFIRFPVWKKRTEVIRFLFLVIIFLAFMCALLVVLLQSRVLTYVGFYNYLIEVMGILVLLESTLWPTIVFIVLKKKIIAINKKLLVDRIGGLDDAVRFINFLNRNEAALA